VKTISAVSCSLAAVVLLAAMAFGSSLSPSEMASTIGGGNCSRCPTSTNASGPSMSCTINTSETGCLEKESCDYKVCESYEHPEAECYNDDDVTAYYLKYCPDGEGGCDVDEGKTGCGCYSDPKTRKGCT